MNEYTALSAFTKKRRLKAGAKYILPDGTNAAMYRCNTTDMYEELSDCFEIARQARLRYRQVEGIDRDEVEFLLSQIEGRLVEAARCVRELHRLLTPELRRDQNEKLPHKFKVTRVVENDRW